MAEQKLVKVKLASAVKHDNIWYQPGDTFEGDKQTVAELIALGAAIDPNTVVEAPADLTVEAEATAKAIVAEAEQVLADAKAEATKLVEQAEVDAQKIRDDAVVATKTPVVDAPAPAGDVAKTKTNTPAK